MWLISRDGFYSIVQKPEDKADDLVTIRARRRDDLERWLKFAPEGEIIDTPYGDYPYRMRLKREAVASIVARTALDINYSNFKNTIADNVRHGVYLGVWSVLRRLENKLRPWERVTTTPTATTVAPADKTPAGAVERTKNIIERKRGGRKRNRLDASYQPTEVLLDIDEDDTIPFDE